MLIASLYDVVVSLDGSGDYRSVTEALANAPQDDAPYVIFIRKGEYHERFEVTRPRVSLIGESCEDTIITSSVANGMLDSQGRKFATFGSRTVSINAPDFSARSLTICNGFDFPANQAKANTDPTRLRHTQAVALLIASHGDRVQLKDVRLISYHDTLYLYAGRSYIEQSLISGTVDFIFGGGTALLEHCDIVARNRDDVHSDEPYGYLVAPCTPIKQSFGLVVQDCRLEKENGVPAGSYGLGRPWHPTTRFEDGTYADPDAVGHAAFIRCQMDDHIFGWDKMSGRDRDRNTIWFYPEDSRFSEYQNRGKGSCPGDRNRPQLTADQVSNYTPEALFSGWVPDISLSEMSALVGTVDTAKDSIPAKVQVTDTLGMVRTTLVDQQGRYTVPVSFMTPPLLVSLLPLSDADESHNMRALVVLVNNQGETECNITAASELMVSDAENRIQFGEFRAGIPVPPLPRSMWEAFQLLADAGSGKIIA
ncbi:pectinesterase family protein [Vibrio salinus]|uniref:pectinesterase family protein n=1 Tax=Vibrio salinus TaxID=2899784 RepID=UPI001E29CA92|nr:pectinesterase family protein [Vibrio salinus]MCE0496047.1 pectinesterase family protein [Vibrio salinus]